ncbi:hypothetical protein ACHAO1_002305 [Botrytis cinerea]
MLLFCPSCSNILTVSVTPHSSTPTPTSTQDLTGANRLECLTCPYQYILTRSIFDRKTFVREEKEDVFGGKDAWANADTYPKQCANSECNGMVAAARFVQIRSADEPMTGFYRVSLLFVFATWVVWGLESRGASSNFKNRRDQGEDEGEKEGEVVNDYDVRGMRLTIWVQCMTCTNQWREN